MEPLATSEMKRRRIHQPVMRDGELKLQCRDCGTWKPVAEFSETTRRKNGRRGYCSYCRRCAVARARRVRWRQRTASAPYVACRVCHYPVRRETTVRGICVACRELVKSRPDWIGAGKTLSHNNPGHEARMRLYGARAAAGVPLFDAPRARIPSMRSEEGGWR